MNENVKSTSAYICDLISLCFQVSRWKSIQYCAKGAVYLQIPPAGVSIHSPMTVFSLYRSIQVTNNTGIFLSETWATTRSTLWPTRHLLTWASSPLCKSWTTLAPQTQQPVFHSSGMETAELYMLSHVIIFTLQNPELQLSALYPQNGL